MSTKISTLTPASKLPKPRMFYTKEKLEEGPVYIPKRTRIVLELVLVCWSVIIIGMATAIIVFLNEAEDLNEKFSQCLSLIIVILQLLQTSHFLVRPLLPRIPLLRDVLPSPVQDKFIISIQGSRIKTSASQWEDEQQGVVFYQKFIDTENPLVPGIRGTKLKNPCSLPLASWSLNTLWTCFSISLIQTLWTIIVDASSASSHQTIIVILCLTLNFVVLPAAILTQGVAATDCCVCCCVPGVVCIRTRYFKHRDAYTQKLQSVITALLSNNGNGSRKRPNEELTALNSMLVQAHTCMYHRAFGSSTKESVSLTVTQAEIDALCDFWLNTELNLQSLNIEQMVGLKASPSEENVVDIKKEEHIQVEEKENEEKQENAEQNKEAVIYV